MFLVGKRVKGGLYGDHPSLSNLDDGDLKFGIDFRSVYATVLEDWLGASAQDLLGGTFDPVHLAHLRLAEEAREQLGLERVLFLPAPQPWRKAGRPASTYSPASCWRSTAFFDGMRYR